MGVKSKPELEGQFYTGGDNSEDLQRLHIALKLARAELVLFFSVALIVLNVAAVGIYYFEGEVQPESFG